MNFDHHDARLADDLASLLGAEGWQLRWDPEPGGGWRAAVSGPGLPHPIAGRGRSRLAAISRAHAEAFLLLTRPRTRTRPL